MNEPQFIGQKHRLAYQWEKVLDIASIQERPIKYLEIGANYGANLIAVSRTFALHPKSEIHCIDPWEDSETYTEYKNEQKYIYESFLQNMKTFKCPVNVHRGYSKDCLLEFEEKDFDIIFVDGNHEAPFVLEDAILSFRKLKLNGILIFDDYLWGQKYGVKDAVDSFLLCYRNFVHLIAIEDGQIFIQKIKNL